MLAMGEWPYMSSIDPEVTSNFFGNATAASKAVNVAFTFLFAIWSHKIHGIKKPMIIGRCITLAACVMYILVEFAPTHRRWWMLVCYLFFGVGFGTGPLLRSYMARVTSEENRSTAYALMSGAMVMSIVIGPPPIWCAVITNIAALAVSVFVLEDTVGDEIAAQQSIPSSFSLATIKDRLSNLRSLDIPWLLAVLVIIERMASNVFNTTMAV
ncbi:hypothetical protein PENTCL1PPCAC_16142 [Pristionchus entomophagus]|uniref:Membrane transporter n=1 Tax=Pristionchus entomophagus TaxID=358040 RepID=A0AAV5TI53_9BILA|nr:hypothetical protein PENTCL1PPCAC_16142 [Pristionchus entomophagus]